MIQSARNPDVPIFDPDNPVIIEAKEAQHHQVYQCCWCSAKMYKKVSPNEIPFLPYMPVRNTPHPNASASQNKRQSTL